MYSMHMYVNASLPPLFYPFSLASPSPPRFSIRGDLASSIQRDPHSPHRRWHQHHLDPHPWQPLPQHQHHHQPSPSCQVVLPHPLDPLDPLYPTEREERVCVGRGIEELRCLRCFIIISSSSQHRTHLLLLLLLLLRLHICLRTS